MELTSDDIGRRFATADRHIRDIGVSYRAYGDTSERAWPLSHVPLLIEASEWREIAAGVEQRARLLEMILADILWRRPAHRGGRTARLRHHR